MAEQTLLELRQRAHDAGIEGNSKMDEQQLRAVLRRVEWTRAVSPFVPLPEPRPLPVGRTADVREVLAADHVVYGLVISRLGGRSG